MEIQQKIKWKDNIRKLAVTFLKAKIYVKYEKSLKMNMIE